MTSTSTPVSSVYFCRASARSSRPASFAWATMTENPASAASRGLVAAAVVGDAGAAGENEDSGDGCREKRPPEAPGGCVLWHFDPFVTSLSPARDAGSASGPHDQPVTHSPVFDISIVICGAIGPADPLAPCVRPVHCTEQSAPAAEAGRQRRSRRLEDLGHRCEDRSGRCRRLGDQPIAPRGRDLDLERSFPPRTERQPSRRRGRARSTRRRSPRR